MEVIFAGEYGIRVVKFDVDAEGQISIVDETRVDSRQSDDDDEECRAGCYSFAADDGIWKSL